MLRSLLTSGGDIRTTLATLLLEIPIILLSLSVHELAHGFVAYKCGDGTAKAFGRLTLNPLKHLDPLGAICMFLTGYGWAKPVPINTRYFKKPKRDLVLVSLAGPVSNFLLAVVFAALYSLVFLAVLLTDIPTGVADALFMLFMLGVLLNLSLGAFNLVPLPPLDGSKILMCLLPGRIAAKYARVEVYARYILLGLVIASYAAPGLVEILFLPISWPVSKLYPLLINGFCRLILLIVGQLA